MRPFVWPLLLSAAVGAMRAVIQRVTSASVTVGGVTISSIGRGLCVLVGIAREDTEKDAEQLCRKVLGMKLWDDAAGSKPWQRSVVTAGYEVLFVSQFTLHAATHKGHRPDFSRAMGPAEAKPFYDAFLGRARDAYRPEAIKDGEFGASMLVDIANDGPVTITLDTASGKAAASEGGAAGAAGGGGGGVGGVTAADAAEWRALPPVPKHDNKKGKPSPEHLAAAKAAKEGRRVFVESLIARLVRAPNPP